MKFNEITNIGKRKNNQDQVCIVQNNASQVLAVICDGMGGHNSGELASKVVCEYIVDCFKIMPAFDSLEEAKIWLEGAVKEAHQITKRLSQTSLVHAGMGTTVVVALVLKEHYLIASVGDSRCYFINHELKLLTIDDTFVNELIKSGMINKDEAKNHPKRNVLMKAIGVSDEIDAKIQIFPLTQGYLLLCSDGLYNSVEEIQLFQIMSTNALLKDKLEALVKLSLNQGASDNISIAAIQIDGGDLDE